MDVDDSERIVSLTEGKVGRSWMQAVRHLREINTTDAIAARVAAGYSDPIDGAAYAGAMFAAGQAHAYHWAGQAHAKWIDTRVNKRVIGFDPSEPLTVQWAQRNRLDKIRQVTEDIRSMVRAVLIDSTRRGENPREAAQRIRDGIGLTDAQEAMVDSYRRQLETRDFQTALDRRLSSGLSDRAIVSAMRQDKPLTKEQITTAVDRYRENVKTYRAEAIMRTEGVRVAHQARDDSYRQAIESGGIRADEIVQTWNHSPTARNKRDERKHHVSMHRQERKWGEPFVSGLGNALRYPCDPEAPAVETIHCRCCLSTRIRPAGARAAV